MALVSSRSYDAGVVNSQVWEASIADGTVDPSRVSAIFTSPPYYDYHWVARPDLDGRFGAGFTDRVVAAFTALDPADPDAEAILSLFGAGSFIPTENANYGAIEAVARSVGLIR
ncbi:MAG: PhnD/SsuA/transferrin family substrate-binding protein [Acidimicrobiales bacterium]